MNFQTGWHALTIYFVLNLFVTFTNKAILDTSSEATSQKTYLLTAVHGISGVFGCFALRYSGLESKRWTANTRISTRRELQTLTWMQHAGVAAFSLFYTINIALSNWSLAMISLPLNQTIRAAAPIITILMSICILKKPLHTYRISVYLSLIPITAGVILAAIGAQSSSSHTATKHTTITVDLVGYLVTLLGALTAVLKTILTYQLMTSFSLQLSPIEMLRILSPYASIQALIFAYLAGELHYGIPQAARLQSFDRSRDTAIHTPSSAEIPCMSEYSSIILWLTNAMAAFLLNVASFQANRICGPISMAVAANLKQVVVLILPAMTAKMGVKITKQEELTGSIVAGTLLTVAGGLWYGLEMAKTKQMNLAAQEEKIAEKC